MTNPDQPSAIWTREQIQQARGLRAEALVDREVIARARLDVLTATRRKLAGRLVDMAHPFVIEINPADLQFSEVEGDTDDFAHVIKVRAWWEPETRVVEFKGGERDGEIMEIRDAGPFGSVRVARMEPINWSNAEDMTAPVPMTVDVYECVGWHEKGRRWIYQVRQ